MTPIALSILLAAAPPIPTLSQSAVLDAPSPTVSPTFGMVIGLSGDRVVATGPDPSKEGGSLGQIATFQLQPTGEWSTFKEMQSIDQVRRGAMVLQRLAFAGEQMLITEDRRDGSSSSVVTFEAAASPSGWRQLSRLESPATSPEPAFGASIATDGTIAAIATVDMRVLGDKPRTVQVAPKVFLFERIKDGWKGLGFLQRDASKQPTFFGASLALANNTLVIGCPKAIPASPHQSLVQGGDSAVVVYRRGTDGAWALDGELTPPPHRVDYLGFGTALATDGERIVLRQAQISGSGAEVLVYKRGTTGWVYDGELAPQVDIVRGPGWGITLAIADGRIVVGDPTALSGEQMTGYVGVFARSSEGNWGESLRLKPSVAVTSSRWGVSLRADGRRVLVARPASEREGIMPGGALLFTLPEQRDAPPVSSGAVAATDVPLAPSAPPSSPAPNVPPK
ncbi:MAG: hypothetical protein FJ285_00970 [Planctomycetes bacterium]|nr:hypothetical protein [Planctomycetota bacterium]